MSDDNSLAAAGYVEQQYLVLVVSASHAPASSSAPLTVATDSNPRFVHSQPKIQAASRTAASATSFLASGVVNCASGHVCQIHTYQNVHRKCSVCSVHIENQSTGARCNTYDVCKECVFKSRTPTIDHSIEWLDEFFHGCLCPNPLASVQEQLLSSATAVNCAFAHAADSPPFSSTKANPATPSAAAVPLRDGSRVRIEGLQAKPEMNGRTGVVRGAFDAQSERWTVEVTADELCPSSLFSFRPANLCVIDMRPSSAPPKPAVNVATEWLDELCCVCPKAVDYASQCPKGHALVPFAVFSVGIFGASEQDIIISHMCRICHTRSESEQAETHWLVCSEPGCCAGYAVCDGCISELHQAPVAVAAGEGFSSQVNRAAGGT